jgi:flagellar motor switch protein FliG
MERARTTGSDREAALRRVAIVLSSLPAPVASQLLSTFDTDSVRRLRHAMTSLADVDPLEHRRALLAFKGSLSHPADPSSRSRQQPATGTDDEVSIGSSAEQGTTGAGSRVVPSSIPDQQSPSNRDNQLAFLADVDDDTLVGMLRGEHPQTIALVLASIAPAQAARILPSLDTALQGDALSRIGRLGEIPDDVVEEIASHLQSRIKQAERVNRSEAGQRALGAILAAMPQSVNHRDAPSTTAEPTSAGSSDRHSHPIPAAHPSPNAAQGATAPTRFSEADLSAVDQTHRLRMVTSLEPDETESVKTRAPAPTHSEDLSTPPDPGNRGADPRVETLASTDSIHRHLLELTPEELCQALGSVATRQAILSLCGLPNEIAEAVLAILPRSQSKQVRRGMASLQSLELREIDEAKEAVAAASIDALGLPGATEATPRADSPIRMAA